MKKFIVIIQSSATNFKALVLKGNNKIELLPMYRHLGMTVDIQEYSQHNMKMAQMQVEQYNGLKK